MTSVIIIGAGISGLALAQGLKKASIPFHVYERDAALDVRTQGYRVRLNEIGIGALRELLPDDLLDRMEKCCAQVKGSGIAPNVTLDALTGLEGEGPIHPLRKLLKPREQPWSCDRSVLRGTLCLGLEKHISFGKDFDDCTFTDDGVLVKFRDGEEVKGKVLVGADGTRSHVRRRLMPTSDAPILDTEGRCIFGKTPLTTEFVERMNQGIFNGLAVISDRSTFHVPMTMVLEEVRFKDNEYRHELPTDYVYWVLVTRKDNFDWSDEEVRRATHADCARLAIRKTRHWHKSLHPLFEMQNFDNCMVIPIVSMHPKLTSWKSQHLVTVIGYAVRAMSPFAGVGATTALRDAAKLMKDFQKMGLTNEAILDYEAEMREYASEAIGRSSIGAGYMFGARPFDDLRTHV